MESPETHRSSVDVAVDKAAFLEVGKVFERVYRSGAANVIFTLRNGRLRVEFRGGGTELTCESPTELIAEVTAKSFAGIIAAHRYEKSLAGTMTLTFRPELGEFATPLAGAKAKFC